MPAFSVTSKARLASCSIKLQNVMNEVIKHIDFKVISGNRTLEEQQKEYELGYSTKDGIEKKSRHQSKPSEAIDIAPYPIDWENTKRFHVLAGFVMGVATEMGIKLRWGGDWDRDWSYKDQKFHDLGHFELVKAA